MWTLCEPVGDLPASQQQHSTVAFAARPLTRALDLRAATPRITLTIRRWAKKNKTPDKLTLRLVFSCFQAVVYNVVHGLRDVLAVFTAKPLACSRDGTWDF